MTLALSTATGVTDFGLHSLMAVFISQAGAQVIQKSRNILCSVVVLHHFTVVMSSKHMAVILR